MKVAVSTATTVVIPLATAFGGLLVGSFFSRLTARNDTRRDRYASALSAVQMLTDANRDGDDVAKAGAASKVEEIANWIALDSTAVSRAFAVLSARAETASGDDPGVAAARLLFIRNARAFSTWNLCMRFALQLHLIRATPFRDVRAPTAP